MSRPTQDTTIVKPHFEYGIITLYDQDFQLVPLNAYSNVEVLQPLICRNKTGLG